MNKSIHTDSYYKKTTFSKSERTQTKLIKVEGELSFCTNLLNELNNLQITDSEILQYHVSIEQCAPTDMPNHSVERIGNELLLRCKVSEAKDIPLILHKLVDPLSIAAATVNRR